MTRATPALQHCLALKDNESEIGEKVCLSFVVAGLNYFTMHPRSQTGPASFWGNSSLGNSHELSLDHLNIMFMCIMEERGDPWDIWQEEEMRFLYHRLIVLYMLTMWEQWEINRLECLPPLMSIGTTLPRNYSAWLTLLLHTVSWLLQMPGVGTRNDSALGQDSPLSGPHPVCFHGNKGGKLITSWHCDLGTTFCSSTAATMRHYGAPWAWLELSSMQVSQEWSVGAESITVLKKK